MYWLGPSIDTAFLQELAGSTDGVFFAAPSSSQLASLFEETANLLRSEYVITADFSNAGLFGDTTGSFRAQADAGNGEVSLTFSLPAPPVPEPTVVPVVEPVPEQGGSNTALILLGMLAVIAVSGGGGWLYWRRRQERLQEATAFETLPPVYGLAEDFNAAQPRRAPPAILRLESGDELLVNGTATLGVDEDCTYRLPLTRGEFGHGQLRIWFANHRYIIHDVAPRPRIRVNGRPVTWSFLGDGDEIEVRGVKLRFTTSPGVARQTSDV
jgi:LPXTG-motif cell wall-anchored protein